jgi:hypothetical protein
VVEVEEGVDAFVDDQYHVAATPSVATVGTATGDILFATKGNATVAAITRSHGEPYRVNKHGSDTDCSTQQRRSFF